MSRKNWSNFFILLAAANLAVAVLPSNDMKLLNWIVLACCLSLGTIARKRMASLVSLAAFTGWIQKISPLLLFGVAGRLVAEIPNARVELAFLEFD
jgi:hypothetical protein